MKAVFICMKCCEGIKDKPCKFVIHNLDRVLVFKEYPRVCPMEISFTGETTKAEWERVK